MPSDKQPAAALTTSPKAKPDTLPTSNQQTPSETELLKRLSLEWTQRLAKEMGVRLL